MPVELDDKLREKLVDLLDQVPSFEDRAARDAWLKCLPKKVQGQITSRHDNGRIDLRFIISAVQPIRLKDGRWAILLLLGNLLKDLEGIELRNDIQKVYKEIAGELESSSEEPGELHREHPQPDQLTASLGDPNRREWLKLRGFKWDPFLHTRGERDPHLQRYFHLHNVSPFWDIVDAEKGPILIFGPPGSGKSSLRSVILRYRKNDRLLAVVYRDFGLLVSKCQEGKNVLLEDHVKQILKTALETLSTQTPTNLNKILRDHLWLYVDRYIDDPYVKEILRNRLKPNPKVVGALSTDVNELLSLFCRDVTKLFSYQFVYILVDPEPADIASNDAIAWQVLSPLLVERRLLEVHITDDIGKEKVIAAFYFFLDQKFQYRALEIPWIRHEQSTRVRSLQWNKDELRFLLQKRLLACSAERYQHLGELSDGVDDLDERVIQLSRDSPRQLIEICDRLFSEHCRRWSPEDGESLSITRQEVDVVLKPFEEQDRESALEQLIAQGESERLEFKSTMRYNYKAGRRDEEMDREIARTLCAFMNAEGGTLIIGVSDNGTALGLDEDFSTLGSRKNKDGFEQAFANIAKNLFDPSVLQRYYRARFEQYHSKSIYVVEVEKNENPVFCLFDGVREFYIRELTATRKLDVKETLDYCKAISSSGVGQQSPFPVCT
jgi:hypothetical protein